LPSLACGSLMLAVPRGSDESEVQAKIGERCGQIAVELFGKGGGGLGDCANKKERKQEKA
jgi:hypothetical protein